MIDQRTLSEAMAAYQKDPSSSSSSLDPDGDPDSSDPDSSSSGLVPPDVPPPPSGFDIWYKVFLWCLCSSVFLYACASVVAFFTLRKHKFGRFYSLMILFMGFVLPLTLGAVSSASVAFVYKTSSFGMQTSHAVMWGVGQTVIHAFFGVTRILATL